MILLEIKQFFRDKPSANLMELSMHFKQSPEAMRMMLSHWLRKGKLQLMPKPEGCGTRCVSCKKEYAETYQWVAA